MKITEEEMRAAMEVAAYKLGVEFYTDWESSSRKGTVATNSEHRRYVVVNAEQFEERTQWMGMRFARDWSSVERAIIEEVEAGVKAAGHRWLQPCWEASIHDLDFRRTAIVEAIGAVEVRMEYGVSRDRLTANRIAIDTRTGNHVGLLVLADHRRQAKERAA